ncbi:hypothetical protein [Microscilla marina]|uniref:Uncharacterized protein n=1 Tax=Microscilla marina ATCC 23134 TaxID=313606 RepID=A1ZSN1_MICM2|nr:hypothetical protein [Microscilla marina]EAY26611.1 hypothetical protein M23134_06140 [Microscilla marina ATCC 23134]
MKQFSKVLLIAFFMGGMMITTTSFAQVRWKKPLHFLYKGTMKIGQKTRNITMGFYWDDNDGSVAGEYYYGSGKNGTISFVGSYDHSTKKMTVNEYVIHDAQRKFTGSFSGTSAKGWYKGVWSNSNGVKMHSFALKLAKVYKK